MVLHLNGKFLVLTSFEKVMDPAPRGLGIPVVTLLLEVKNTLIWMKYTPSINFLVLFVTVKGNNFVLTRVGRMPSLR